MSRGGRVARSRRNYYGLPSGQEINLAGVRALADGHCTRCDDPVLKEQRVVPAGDGRWMHVGCASGGGDE